MALPKACPKWRTMDGSWDAVTAFGVRILKPEIGEWREVRLSNDGGVFSITIYADLIAW